MKQYQASYYNMVVDHGQTTLLFNGVSSALLALNSRVAESLAPFMGDKRDRKAGTGYSTWRRSPFFEEDLPQSVKSIFPSLVGSGVFVEAGKDERDMLRRSYINNRARAPLFVTITTTLDCNMRCYYCYQKDDKLEHMSIETCDEIIHWTISQIKAQQPTKFYVDWYGGEPMLNQPVIDRYSAAVIEYCDSAGVDYKASMICNGTAWPEAARDFVSRNRLHSIQFSIDGPEKHHNKRRGLIDPNGGPGRQASFSQVLDVIDLLVGSTKIYLRINVDPYIGRDALQLVDICNRRGWLTDNSLFYPYLAVINAMTEHCGFVGKSPKFKAFETEFDEIQAEFYRQIGKFRDQKSLEVVQYFPNRVTINCAAVSNNAIVFGPNGLTYKCGLDVGDEHRAHGILKNGQMADNVSTDVLPVDRWERYDPFIHPTCSECQYLPVCMGGCPKAQIDRDDAQIKMQSVFWESNFDRIIQEYYSAAGH